jgi:AcrR family transcriptional regulator
MKVMHRHRAKTPYPRGEETRSRIISTALILFSQKGFDGVSTREIAAQAGVPPPSLQYYFDNKRGLYLACRKHIEDLTLEGVGPALQSAEELLASEATSEQLIHAYCYLQDRLANFLLAPDPSGRGLFITHMPLDNVSIDEVKSDRMAHCFLRLATRIAGARPAEDPRLIVGTVNSLLMGIFFGLIPFKALAGWENITPHRLEILKGIVWKHTALLLRSYASREGGSSPSPHTSVVRHRQVKKSSRTGSGGKK